MQRDNEMFLSIGWARSTFSRDGLAIVPTILECGEGKASDGSGNTSRGAMLGS